MGRANDAISIMNSQLPVVTAVLVDAKIKEITIETHCSDFILDMRTFGDGKYTKC